ncbi:MAG: sigma 54-interacting transcriptional regulator [Bacteroidetes bacterium]|nr:sigma 54-interacting transcriptional regulator [Bacteroidota bacterium]MCW5895068.1 sigma 54-interacting transcriptional regulator [Bacteroidota bacterium]
MTHPLFHRKSAEYVVFDESFRIASFSTGAARYADDAGAVTIGEDIRLAFPELAGFENDMLRMLRGASDPILVRNISRNRIDDTPSGIDLSIETARAGDMLHGIVLLEDVSERLRIEQQLVQQSNEAKLLLQNITAAKTYFERIIDSLADALFVTTSDGTIQTVNRVAAELFGYHKGELIGRSIQTITGSQELLPSTGNLTNTELSCTTKQGSRIPVAFSCSAMQHEGTAEELVFLGRDLRERKNAEAEIRKLRSTNLYLNEEIQAEHNFEEIIGTAPVMKKLFRQIEKVAATDSTVLLEGETGTGKELFARAIHNLSSRKKTLLVKVNCAALPAGLVESELFGHEKGAFTGAFARKIGRFEFANEGTLFLDEIGELPLETQVKLLRVLQEREFERVGGTEPIRTNVRVVAASNRNLEEQVQLGAFRSDLYFRLKVFPVRIPPLRERRDDIPFLADYFIRKFSLRMHKRVEGLHPDTLDRMIQYDWPGNVRELAATLERAIILCEGGQLRDIDLTEIGSKPISRKTSALKDVEREHILQVLREADGVIEGKNGAAIRLKMNASTLRSRMKKLGIHRKGAMFI